MRFVRYPLVYGYRFRRLLLAADYPNIDTGCGKRLIYLFDFNSQRISHNKINIVSDMEISLLQLYLRCGKPPCPFPVSKRFKMTVVADKKLRQQHTGQQKQNFFHTLNSLICPYKSSPTQTISPKSPMAR